MSENIPRVVIGMDPHKRTATIEVMTADETIVGRGQFTTDTDGYTAMLDYGRQWPDRTPSPAPNTSQPYAATSPPPRNTASTDSTHSSNSPPETPGEPP